jgi:ABC-type uncharacterized transport system YnjBCD permease subunit
MNQHAMLPSLLPSARLIFFYFVTCAFSSLLPKFFPVNGAHVCFVFSWVNNLLKPAKKIEDFEGV